MRHWIRRNEVTNGSLIVLASKLTEKVRFTGLGSSNDQLLLTVRTKVSLNLANYRISGYFNARSIGKIGDEFD